MWGVGRFGKIRSIVRYMGEVYLTNFPFLYIPDSSVSDNQ